MACFLPRRASGDANRPHGLIQPFFLIQRKKGVKVVYQNDSVLDPHDSGNVSHARQYVLSGDNILAGRLNDTGYAVDDEADAPLRTASNDNLVARIDRSLGKPEPLADVDHRNDPAPQIDHSQDNLGSAGQRNDFDSADQAFDGIYAQSILLFFKNKHEQLIHNWLRPMRIHRKPPDPE